MKLLNEVLYNWNMRMNDRKTFETSDIVTSSIKPEKLEEIYIAPSGYSSHKGGYWFQKSALRIYTLSKKYPNAGLIARNMTEYYDRLKSGKKEKKFDYEIVVAVMTMIAFHSPRYMPQAASIITAVIDLSGKKLDRKAVITKILKKFEDVPNTELIDIWLQRITDSDEIRSYKFKSSITQVALNDKDNSAIWNSAWLNKSDRKTIGAVKISSLIEQVEAATFSPIVGRDEFELYRSAYEQ